MHRANWERAALVGWLAVGGWWGRSYATEDPQTLYEAGLRALEERRQAPAEQAFRRCLELDSTFYDAYVSLARICLSRNSLDQANSLLTRAVRQQPQRVEARFELGKVYSRQGRPEEAYAQLREVAGLEPRTAAAYMGIGYLRMEPTQMMDLQEAAAAFAKAHELEPGNLEAAFNLGKVRLSQGDRDAAITTFRALVGQNPKSLPARYQLGMALYLKMAYADAASELRRAAELGEGSLMTLWALYLAYQQVGGYPEDLADTYKREWERKTGRGSTVRFVDVAQEAGVARSGVGRGSAWADYDADGDLDLFAVRQFAASSLFRNDGGVFVDVAAAAGVEAGPGMSCAFADYDNDGDPDLYIARNGWYGKAPNTLYRNEGNGRYADVSAAAGVDDGGSSFTACWGDVDNDGFLDLVVANGVTGDGSPNRLYHSDRQGGFQDVAAAAGIRPGRSIGSALGDYDNDGDLDLYLVNFSNLNSFYRNDTDPQGGGVVFTDVTRETRTQLPLGGYFAFFLDFDNDGNLDLFCSEMSDYEAALYSKVTGRTRFDRNRPALYRNEGDGSFADATYQAGLGKSFGSTGVQSGDFNGDGYPDIYLSNGGAEVERLEPDALLLNQRDGTFVDIAADIGLQQLGKGQGVSFADYDADGDEDVFISVGGTFPGDPWPSLLLRNDSQAHSWLTLRLIATRSNRDGIGARVRVRAGGQNRYAQVSSGGGSGINSLPVEMGLGQAQRIDEVEIRWPSGQVDVHKELAVNQALVVREGESLR
jgi:tetratricopeptide (TPR) repeat protein